VSLFKCYPVIIIIVLFFSVSFLVYITPECMVEQWNFWNNVHKRTVKGGSPLTRSLGIEMTKLMATEMHRYWHTKKCLGG